MARARKKKDEEQQEQVEETPAEPTAEDAPPAEESPAAEEAAPAAEEAPAEEAPVSEEPAEAVEPVAEQPPAPAPRKRAKPKAKKAESLPKKKKRAASRARGTGERKPIVRLPKPEHARGRRKERRGTVVSSAMDKTIVVRVDTSKPHPRYKKVVRRSTKVHAHDEANAAGVGDVVRIVETRPLSRTKRWRLAEVMEVAK